jgi:hypothetical protein
MAVKSVEQKTKRNAINHLVIGLIGSACVIAGWIGVVSVGFKGIEGKGWLILVVGTVAAPLMVFFAIRDLLHPEKSKIMSSIAAKGPTAVAEVNAVIAGSVPTVDLGDMKVSQGWVVHKTGDILEAVRTSDVVWVYQQVVRHSVNGIPTGKSYNLSFTTATETVSAEVPKQAADDAITLAAKICPTALIGFNEDLGKLIMKNRGEALRFIKQMAADQRAGAKSTVSV